MPISCWMEDEWLYPSTIPPTQRQSLREIRTPTPPSRSA